jgi:hypothetical protein
MEGDPLIDSLSNKNGRRLTIMAAGRGGGASADPIDSLDKSGVVSESRLRAVEVVEVLIEHAIVDLQQPPPRPLPVPVDALLKRLGRRRGGGGTQWSARSWLSSMNTDG